MSHDDLEPGVIIKLRRDTTINWSTDNPVLAEGETGWDTDLLRVKLGDGVTAWNDLPYAIDGPEGEVDTVATVPPVAGDIPTAALKTALSLPSNTVTDLGSLDTRVDALEATEATYGDIVTHNASEFTTDAELATVQADVNTRQRTLFYGHDIANTATALGVGVLTALPLTYSIPPSDIDVSVEWGGLITITTAGSGAVIIGPCDVSAGAPPTGFLSYAASLAGSFTSGAWGQAPSFKGSVNIGPSALWRTIRLYGFVGRDATLAASNRASGANPPSTKTWMRVYTG